MKELKIWNNFTELKESGIFEIEEYFGYVYFVEYGKYLKIGCTKNPLERLRTLSSNAKLYHDVVLGRIYITPMHTNYPENERILHRHFALRRKDNSELFSISIEEAIGSIAEIPLSFLDESAEKEERHKKIIEGIIKYISQSKCKENMLVKTSDFGCILAIILDLLSEIVELYEEINNLTDDVLNCIDTEIPDEIFNQIMSLGNNVHTLNEKERSKLHELFGV